MLGALDAERVGGCPYHASGLAFECANLFRQLQLLLLQLCDLALELAWVKVVASLQG